MIGRLWLSPHQTASPRTGYWYESLDSQQIALLKLLRDYHDAERDSRARTCEKMRMNETEILALQFLLNKTHTGEDVLQCDLAKHLKITGASASALSHRLQRDRYIKRVPHPSDGRATLLTITEKADGEMSDALTAMHQPVLDAIQQLDSRELAAVQKFLSHMIDAMK